MKCRPTTSPASPTAPASTRPGWNFTIPAPTSFRLNGLYLANNYTNLLQWAFPVQRRHQPRPVQGDLCRRPDQPLHHQRIAHQFCSAQRLRLGGLDPARHQRPAAGARLCGLSEHRANDSYGSFPDGQSFYRQEFFQATPGAPNNGTATPPPSFIAYTDAGSVYTQNFDSLPDPGADFGQHAPIR